MGLIRSFFDLLYAVLNIILSLSKHRLSNLPVSLGGFSDRAYTRSTLKGKDLSEYLKSSYGFNDPFVDFFTDILPLFRLCRKIRDSIYHSGKTPEIIFITEKGPAIGMGKIGDHEDPFYGFRNFFEDDMKFLNNLLENDLVSLFYFVNGLIQFTLKSSDKFANALIQSFNMPEGISNDYFIFLRGPEIEFINRIPQYLKQFWLSPINKI